MAKAEAVAYDADKAYDAEVTFAAFVANEAVTAFKAIEADVAKAAKDDVPNNEPVRLFSVATPLTVNEPVANILPVNV